jgi:hypothetical protein
MQALVENIPWREARLAYDSIASIACLMLAARYRAAGSLKLCRAGGRGVHVLNSDASSIGPIPINFEMSEIPSDSQFKLATF